MNVRASEIRQHHLHISRETIQHNPVQLRDLNTNRPLVEESMYSSFNQGQSLAFDPPPMSTAYLLGLLEHDFPPPPPASLQPTFTISRFAYI